MIRKKTGNFLFYANFFILDPAKNDLAALFFSRVAEIACVTRNVDQRYKI